MKVLLIEPFYRNKYPPLGLMKISAYHKSLGHEVTFIKEKLQDYLKKEKTKACLLKIRQQLFKLEDRNGLEDSIIEFMKKPSKIGLDKVLSLVPKDSVFTTENILQYYRRDYYYEKLWDRVYITSLFTFNFIETLDAVELAKKLVKKNGTIYLGGISVSLNPEIYAERTGLEIGKNIITGLLDKPGIFDENDIIVDRLVPDYSILETIEYKYPQFTGYLTYATRGCTRCCDFCAVPKLEPVYKNYISVTSQIETIREKYGEQKDLILLDNNVLASNRFKEIIKDIKSLGFHRNAMYFEQNKLKFYYQYILAEKNTQNKDIFSEKLIKYLYWVANRRIKRKSENERFTQLLNEIHMGPKYQLSLEVLDHHYQEIYNLINNHLLKIGKHRYVDFNQGIDCRYITDEIMQLLSEIAIKPLRIAFDHMSLKNKYINSIKLASKYNIKHLSNYLLFNYKDKPVDLWRRMKINVELNNEFENIDIFSFPMRYVPLFGKESLNREYVGKYWNPKYLRAVQLILNVTKGIGMTGKSFFEKAFGKDEEEYLEILKLPSNYILYRYEYETNGRKDLWKEQYSNLDIQEKLETDKVILSNDFKKLNAFASKGVKEFIMEHYMGKN